MGEGKRTVYCSGALFNEKEREEMQQIAAALEKAGFATFLPQRDGLEFTPLAPILVQGGMSQEDAEVLWGKSIFALDAYQVSVCCDAVVVNLNGRVPDEGAVSEAAMAWRAGKVVVGYKDDLRTLYFGKDNPMVTGLCDFQIANGIYGVVSMIKEKLEAQGKPAAPEQPDHPLLRLGKSLWEIKRDSGDFMKIAELLTAFAG